MPIGEEYSFPLPDGDQKDSGREKEWTDRALQGSVNSRITRLSSCEPLSSTSTVGESVISTSQIDDVRTDVAPTSSMGENSSSDDTGSSTIAEPRWRPTSDQVHVI